MPDGKTPYPRQARDELIYMPLHEDDFVTLFGSVEDYLWLRLFLARDELKRRVVSSLTTFTSYPLRRCSMKSLHLDYQISTRPNNSHYSMRWC